MKKSIWTLIILVGLGIAGQACESSSDFEDIVVKEKQSNQGGSGSDQKDVPGGGG